MHSYNAALDFNPKAISISGNVGSSLVARDRDDPKDGKVDGFERERVLIPDAKANIKFSINDYLSFGIDPLPPSIGVHLAWRFYPNDDRNNAITFAPSANYLVYPLQKTYSFELPVAISHKLKNWLVVYYGPKGVYQSGVLRPETAFIPKLIMLNVEERDPQDFRWLGGFVGFALGGVHLQFSPEVDYLYNIGGDAEHVILFGVGLRLAL